MFKLKLNNMIIKPHYNCKLTNVEMNKPCPIRQCHANIPGAHKTNCLYVFYSNKIEFDKYDLMYATNINDKQFRENFIKSKSDVYETAILYNILNKLRDNDKEMHCSLCGIIRSTRGTCLNTVECNKRQIFCKEFIAKSRLCYPEFKTNNNDVFNLLRNKDKIDEYVLNYSNEKKWYDILCINTCMVEKSNLIRDFI